MSEEAKCILYGIVLGTIIAATLNSMPFADARKFRDAIAECEKTLPRNQTCRVIGVIDNTNTHKETASK